jgi:hypothetical protein
VAGYDGFSQIGQNPEPASRWFPDRPEQRINTWPINYLPFRNAES